MKTNSTMHKFSLISGCVDYLIWILAPLISHFLFLFVVCLFVCLSGGVSVCTIYMQTVTYRTSPVCNTLPVPIYVCENILLLLFLCWLSGEFLV